MKAVTDAFRLALEKGKAEALREVAYKRRRWSQEDQEYQWEADWTVLARGEVQLVSQVTEQLDTDQLNEFKVSNVTLTLHNKRNLWREDNPFGRFARDAASPNFPYDPYWTKFRVRVGVTLADASVEYATVFTGLATEFTAQSNDTVQVTVEGLESLLIGANAEDVSTTVTEENAGTGNGVTTEFTTANPGVGIIVEVSLNGIEQTAGTDYDVSQLDEPLLGAKVTFDTPPAGAVVVRITYRFWQQNKRIEELVRSLLTAAGIDAADQVVDPVLFSAPILNAVVIDAQSHWQGGTLTAIDYTTVPGSIKIDTMDAQNYTTREDFSSGNLNNWAFGGNIVWTVANPSPGVYHMRYDKGGVTNKGTARIVEGSQQIGRWEWSMNGVDTSFDKVSMWFQAAAQVFETTFPFNPYSFTGNGIIAKAPPYSGSGNTRWEMWLNNTLAAAADFNVGALGGTTQICVVKRYSNGVTQFFINDQLILQGQNATPVSTQWFGIGTEQGAFIITDREFGYFKVPQPTFTGNWKSGTYDLSSGVVLIGRLIADYTPGDGSVTFYTRTSADGATWDAWTPINANGQVQSTVRRYLQVMVDFSASSSSYNESVVNSIRVEYQSIVATITLAKFTGQTVYDAIKSLGSFSNYEYGFAPDETFFFRSRAGSVVSAETLDRWSVKDITGLVTGWDRVYSRVEVTYGNFTAVQQAAGDAPQDPKARFRDKTFQLSVTDIIIGNDADVAHGVSKIFFADLAKPRRRFKAKCRFLPQVDLSDVLEVSFDQNRPTKAWHMGDANVDLGDQDAQLWGPKEQLVSEMLVKVIGARHDLQAYLSEFDVQEVLR